MNLRTAQAKAKRSPWIVDVSQPEKATDHIDRLVPMHRIDDQQFGQLV